MARKKTGVALNHIPFVAAYSSVLKRTIATASHIIGERDIPLFHHQGLNEQYFGSWEGQLVDTLREHPRIPANSLKSGQLQSSSKWRRNVRTIGRASHESIARHY